tara:strand:+ start:294 stop:683 length:390 start_codon:yes stop_codon:yes gene_type:complete
MSFFQKEIQRLNDAECPPDAAELLENPEVRNFMAELQRSMVCWEPWLLKDWPQDRIESLGLSSQYQETLAMVAAAALHDLERYTELYQRFRDHKEFEFDEFFREVLKMAEQQGFEWEGPMDKLPAVPET